MCATRLFSCVALVTWLGCGALAAAQSRLIGDTYTFSGTNYPGNIGATEDPVTGEVTDHGTSPVTVTIDGNAEVAGGMRVNERVVAWPGEVGGIPAVQEAGIDGETEFYLTDWENVGEVLEFSFQTVDGQWISDEILDQSFATLRGVDWAKSEPGSEPYFYETGFYFYWTVDGQPLRDYVMTIPDLGILVGPHPFDPSIPEVAYIAYSRGQVEEVTTTYPGGADFSYGTTQLDEQQGSWAMLASVLSLPGLAEINGKPSNGFYFGVLVTPPPAASLTGDHNGNGNLDAGDLDLQAGVMVSPPNPLPAGYDLNGDNAVNFADRQNGCTI